jgi:hypothetical protein
MLGSSHIPCSLALNSKITVVSVRMPAMGRRQQEYLPDFTERAQVAYQRLSAQDQARINWVLDDIQTAGLRSRAVARMPRVHAPRGIYLARAGARLLIIFQYEDGIFTILDIVRHDQVTRLARLYGWYEG